PLLRRAGLRLPLMRLLEREHPSDLCKHALGYLPGGSGHGISSIQRDEQRRGWRRERDSNPRRAFDPYALSRGAPSTTRPSLRAGGGRLEGKNGLSAHAKSRGAMIRAAL